MWDGERKKREGYILKSRRMKGLTRMWGELRSGGGGSCGKGGRT